MTRVIGVLSGKGGVGKTTMVANLGAALSYIFKKKVVLIDCNVTASHLRLHFGLYGKMAFTIEEVSEGAVPNNHSFHIHPSGLKIIPAPLALDSKIDLKKIGELVKNLANSCDIVIFDCTPGLGREVISVCNAIDEALIVTAPDIPSVTDALRTINILEKLEIKITGIILNRFKGKNYDVTVDEIESICNVPVISVIPEDSKIPESILRGMPITLYDKNSKISSKLEKLAAYLIGEEFSAPSLRDRIKSFFRPKKLEKTKELADIEKLKTELRERLKQDLEEKLIELRKKLSKTKTVPREKI